MSKISLTRRNVLIGMGVAAGSLVIAVPVLHGNGKEPSVEMSSYIAIARTGVVTIVCPGSDMGQGYL